MIKRLTIIIMCLLLLGVAAAIYGFRSLEPTHNGRTLRSWLERLDSSFPRGGHVLGEPWQARMTAQQAEAASAIRAIGASALPYFISSLTNSGTRRDTDLYDSLARLTLCKVQLSAAERKHRAALGLAALGPMSKAAVPELTKALGDLEIAPEVGNALGSIGPEGWTVLSSNLTNTNLFVAAVCTLSLSDYRAAVPGTTASLMANVTNEARAKDLGVISLKALTVIERDSENVVPFLISTLTSSNAAFRREAVLGLARFEGAARSAVPALLRVLRDGDPSVARAAENALKQIDPEVFPIDEFRPVE